MSSPAGSPPGSPTDFAFGLPDTLPAGLTELRLVNHGSEAHHSAMVRVTGNHAPQEVVQALEQPPLPDWVTLVAAPHRAAPHDSSNTTRE